MKHQGFFNVGALTLLATVLFLVSGAHAASKDYGVEANVNNGYTGNLTKDSSDRKDTYTNSSLGLNLYPLSFTRVKLTTSYTYYNRNFGLSSLQYGGGLTFVPTSAESRLSIYADGTIKHHKYREEPTPTAAPGEAISRNDFPTDDISASTVISYRLSTAARARIGSNLTSTGYSTSDLVDKNKLQLFAGTNLTVFHFLALDVEGGYDYGNFSYVNAYRTILDTIIVPTGIIRGGEQYSILKSGRLKSYYFSPRVSFSLGKRTGASLTFGYKAFLDKDSAAIVYGNSTGYISPWGGEYDGNFVQAKFKSYLIPHLITTVGAGFWNKAYLKTLEDHPFDTTYVLSTVYAKDRADDQTRVFLNVQIPLVIQHNWHLEPSIRFDFTHNASSIDVYRYNEFSVSTGFNIQM